MPARRSTRSLPAGLTALGLSLLLISGLAVAQTFSPVYLPAIYREHTPTATPLAGSIDLLQGTLALCAPAKTVYAVGENVCVVESLYNPNAGAVTFGLAGVNIVKLPSGSGDRFQTSWGEGREAWTLCGGCTGPLDGSGGPWTDEIRGLNNTGFTTAGQYQLTFAVCYANYSACPTAPNSQWRNYTTLTITVQ